MNNMLTFFLFFISSLFSLAAHPLLVAVLMIKNEAPVIRQTLEPLIKSGITQFLIYDTGSTDDTVKITRDFFKQKNINAQIIQEEFVDFSTSRNRALDYAEQKFPRAEFMIMPDAEWYLENGTELIRFCQAEYHKHPKITSQTPHAYFIHIQNPETAYRAPILIRCKTQTRFKGVVHETIFSPAIATTPSSFFFKRMLLAQEPGWEKTKKRYVRDRDLLLNELKKNPEDPRSLFYLAQTYSCMGDYENAYKYYQLRTTVEQYGEEYYLAFYRLGLLAEKMHAAQPEKYAWACALAHYLDAYTTRPCRIEPLVMIAQYYWNRQEYAPCMLFIKQAASQPYPAHDGLMVEAEYYTYHRYDLLARCALQVGEAGVAQWAIEQALHNHPQDAHFLALRVRCQQALDGRSIVT